MSNLTSALAIIPARGGSKGIPGKNIKMLAGKPLIAWTIEAALQAQTIERVVVSTDSEEIAAVSRQFGAEVVMRPPELAQDFSSSETALLHVLETLAQTEDYQPQALAFLQCTSPLTLPDDIDGTVKLITVQGYDSAVTMIPFHYFIWKQNQQDQMEGVNHIATRRLMRQEREPEYLEIGAVYAMRVEGFLQNRFRFFGRIGQYLISPKRAFEIDEPEDWDIANTMLRQSPKYQPPASQMPSLANIKAVITDFDGVLTDNRVHVDQNGVESVVCNRGDGWGISLLKKAGILVACISTEKNPVVQARCEKLNIPYWQDQHDKLTCLKNVLQAHNLNPQDCIYIGNDTNDADCLAYVGLGVVPADAAAEVKPLARWQTHSAGGEGVLREVASKILSTERE